MAGLPTAGEVTAGLYGAVRLLRGDRTGLQYFRSDATGFYQSFFAALLILPPFALLLALEYGEIYAPEGVGVIPYWITMMSAYAMGWCAYPILMNTVCDLIQRKERFITFVIAYNWAGVLQNGVYLGLELARASGLLPGDAAAFLALIVLGGVLVFAWYIAVVALDVTGPQAIGLVVMDLLLSMVIHGTARAILLN